MIGAAALLVLGASFQVAVPAGHTGVATIFGKVQMEVAASPNTKTIIVGSGKDGLPIILNPGQGWHQLSLLLGVRSGALPCKGVDSRRTPTLPAQIKYQARSPSE